MSSVKTWTETLGGIEVEVDRIPAGKHAEISLTRVPPQGTPGGSAPHGTPVILVHGNFSNRGFWISPKGLGLAPFLAGRGFDAWAVELRGHGRSAMEEGFSRITAEDHIQTDLPAAANHVWDRTGKRSFLVGHSAGGLFVASMLSAGCVPQDRFLGAALFGTQISLGEDYLKVPPLAWLCTALLRVMGQLPAPGLGLGPEPEPAGEMIEFIQWKKRGGQWQDSRGFSYGEGRKQVRMPILAVSGALDKNDPPEGCLRFLEPFGSKDKRFVVLSRENGFLQDYDHVGMIVSREAAREVWPLLADWMDEHRKP
jgi:pimeloyl-ACP methyl ester carboxylesterase